MTRSQSFILNLIAVLVAVFLFFNIGVSMMNKKLAITAEATREELSGVPQLQRISQNLIVRIAEDSRNDRELRQLLEDHDLQVKYKDEANAPSEVRDVYSNGEIK